MQDIIQLLPEHLANQIAAGEVIQRPASVVKELLENAIDAGATDIQLLIRDAGKELIQVIDNGCGMSPIDARMSFERHATSKIKQIDDLFSIRTMGFRGEALASIAAVAQVDLKTRIKTEETGTHIIIEATEVKSQEVAACAPGTSFAVKNLFYNVPARRKFLKSNTSEYKHILDEFTRVAMAYPGIAFRLFHNQAEQFHLKAENLKNRIIGLLGGKAEKNLVPVSEHTELLGIEGYIGKPEAASRTRGNQFFFVNNRFIRSPYLNHAVMSAFEGLIDKEAFPYYVLFIELDPQRVDVNVHPSKQEVKFDDERMLYAYIQAAVKHALAKFNLAPSLDFTLSPEIQNLESVRLPLTEQKKEAAATGFLQHAFSESGRAHLIDNRNARRDWEIQKKILFSDFPPRPETPAVPGKEPETDAPQTAHNPVLQWGPYLITTVKSGFMLLHQKRAQERIVYEKLLEKMRRDEPAASQQLLFPVSFEAAPSDTTLLEEAIPFLKNTGYDIAHFGRQSYVIQGAPPGIPESSVTVILEHILEQIKQEPSLLKDPAKEQLLRHMSRQLAQASPLSAIQAQALVDELFACSQPQYAPDGKNIFLILSRDNLSELL